MTQSKTFDREAAKQQPESTFSRPLHVVEEKLLTKDEKIAMLERWRQSILQQLAATNEGTPSQNNSSDQPGPHALFMVRREEPKVALRSRTPAQGFEK